jgi:uncharacterized protein YjiS (DUF1127 family)
MISADTDYGGENRAPLLLSELGRLHVGTRAASDEVAQPKQRGGTLSSWYAAISTPAIALLSKLRQVRERRRAIAELQNLDDRSLRDIGICRGEIENLIRRG